MVYAEGIHADPPEPEGEECHICYAVFSIGDMREVSHPARANYLVCKKCYENYIKTEAK